MPHKATWSEVSAHELREVGGEAEGEAGVNGAGGFGFLVTDIDGPGGDFVAVGVLLGLGSVEEYASPGSWVGEFGGLLCYRIGRVVSPFNRIICLCVHGLFFVVPSWFGVLPFTV